MVGRDLKKLISPPALARLIAVAAFLGASSASAGCPGALVPNTPAKCGSVRVDLSALYRDDRSPALSIAFYQETSGDSGSAQRSEATPDQAAAPSAQPSEAGGRNEVSAPSADEPPPVQLTRDRDDVHEEARSVGDRTSQEPAPTTMDPKKAPWTPLQTTIAIAAIGLFVMVVLASPWTLRHSAERYGHRLILSWLNLLYIPFYFVAFASIQHPASLPIAGAILLPMLIRNVWKTGMLFGVWATITQAIMVVFTAIGGILVKNFVLERLFGRSNEAKFHAR